MTVDDLIDVLKNYPGNMAVSVCGEGGHGVTDDVHVDLSHEEFCGYGQDGYACTKLERLVIARWRGGTRKEWLGEQRSRFLESMPKHLKIVW